jgi:hypothetical protein
MDGWSANHQVQMAFWQSLHVGTFWACTRPAPTVGVCKIQHTNMLAVGDVLNKRSGCALTSSFGAAQAPSSAPAITPLQSSQSLENARSWNHSLHMRKQQWAMRHCNNRARQGMDDGVQFLGQGSALPAGPDTTELSGGCGKDADQRKWHQGSQALIFRISSLS